MAFAKETETVQSHGKKKSPRGCDVYCCLSSPLRAILPFFSRMKVFPPLAKFWQERGKRCVRYCVCGVTELDVDYSDTMGAKGTKTVLIATGLYFTLHVAENEFHHELFLSLSCC